MDDYRDAIVSCCKQLRLSANLADNAFAIQGESHQEYLYNLLSECSGLRVPPIRNGIPTKRRMIPTSFLHAIRRNVLSVRK